MVTFPDKTTKQMIRKIWDFYIISKHVIKGVPTITVKLSLFYHQFYHQIQ